MPQWRKALSVLAARSKIDSAAIFDMNGNLLSRTENFAEKQEDIMAVLHVLTSSNQLKLIKLSVFGDVFTCVCPGQAGVLLANSEGRLFVAVRTLKCMVIAFSNEEARGSCLYHVMEFCKMLESKGG
ncbi:hypothetical protein BaRGS_00000495 [Batillaria attramentaria]|uniref:Profilin n=1 Tax=Batillaria attramentaria TaxID=370345 RepID=A0ABD0M9Z6_9CAEN|nr:hypothetical protein BaRGS_020344 [Batillaria attramentaria]